MENLKRRSHFTLFSGSYFSADTQKFHKKSLASVSHTLKIFISGMSSLLSGNLWIGVISTVSSLLALLLLLLLLLLLTLLFFFFFPFFDFVAHMLLFFFFDFFGFIAIIGNVMTASKEPLLLITASGGSVDGDSPSEERCFCFFGSGSEAVVVVVGGGG
ncbi:hypothetical protein Lal_00035199 [Lupinus albus]|nr:hypothetical protein Lal_00035199 [Lupinus albus]